MFIFFLFYVDVLLDLCRTVLQMLFKSTLRQLMRIYFNISVLITFVIRILLARIKIRNTTVALGIII